MYTTNLPFVWGFARRTFHFLHSSNPAADGDYNTERYAAGRGAANIHSATGLGDSRAYNNLETVNTSRTGGGIPKSESEERIFEMKGLGEVGPMDYAKMPDGSETISWAQSGGPGDEDESLKHRGIKKTTEVMIHNEGK